MINSESIYLKTDLTAKSELVLGLLKSCELCPKKCKVNRLKDEVGYCQTGRWAIVSSSGPHFGEESELIGSNGSGTIFFGHCNLSCCFCQNYDISQFGHGQITKPEELANIMLSLQKMGCHNINLVSPSHIVAQFIESLAIAKNNGLHIPIVYNTGGYDSVSTKNNGLHIPIVYNTGGYDSVSTLKFLDGIIDIYMPDAKYSDSELAEEYSSAPDYFEINKLAMKEMHRQVGNLKTDNRGVVLRGLLIRLLVLPNRIAGSFKVLEFIANEISKESYVNIMLQYRPCYQAEKHSEINRSITRLEYQEVIEFARKIGLHRGF